MSFMRSAGLLALLALLLCLAQLGAAYATEDEVAALNPQTLLSAEDCILPPKVLSLPLTVTDTPLNS